MSDFPETRTIADGNTCCQEKGEYFHGKAEIYSEEAALPGHHALGSGHHSVYTDKTDSRGSHRGKFKSAALNDPEIVAAYKAKYGLDEPLIVQYFMYLGNLLHLDLGTSIRTNNPVLSELARCYPATIELALFSIILAAIFGILFGVISAIRRNSVADQAVRAVSVTGVSIPSFWFALLVLFVFYYKLHWFPVLFKQYVCPSGDSDRALCDRQSDRRQICQKRWMR